MYVCRKTQRVLNEHLLHAKCSAGEKTLGKTQSLPLGDASSLSEINEQDLIVLSDVSLKSTGCTGRQRLVQLPPLTRLSV